MFLFFVLLDRKTVFGEKNYGFNTECDSNKILCAKNGMPTVTTIAVLSKSKKINKNKYRPKS